MSYRKSVQTAIEPNHGDTSYSYAFRLKKMARDTRNLYWMSHETKHFCHYGPFPCYLCPILEGLEHLADDLIEQHNLLIKLKKEMVWHNPKNAFGKWQIKPTR